ncbi:MAG: hypothetical protein NT069_05650 [Planctomycetota bacterium]|nr:hypothetical protein [Planctomycetota bacterium]
MPRETQSVGTSTGPGNAGEFPWPHAPTHRLSEFGTYIITGSTYNKQHHFRGFDRLEYLTKTLLTGLRDSGWHVEAWAVFSNHYHFVAHAGHNCDKLGLFLKRLHGETAIEINARDAKPKRMVWFNFWDTQLTYENSYLARLHYVHQNPVRHGLVSVANQYRWCSAGWFERTARPAQVKTIYSFGLDRVKVRDDFEPVI